MRLFGAQLLDVIEQIHNAATPADVVEKLKLSLREVGAESFAIHFATTSGEPIEDLMVHWHVPDQWREAYGKTLYKDDPGFYHVSKALLPFDWLEAPNNYGLDPSKVEKCREVAADCHVEKGIVVPIGSPEGALGGMWFGGPYFNDRKYLMPVLHAIAHYAFIHARQLVGVKPGDKPRPKLSGREKEVLTWVYNGKTSWEIGEILSMSQRTVEWHVQRVMKKLNASNRMQAVLLAVADRLIVPAVAALGAQLFVWLAIIDPLMMTT